MKNDKRMTYKNEYGEWCVKSTEAQNIAINTNKDKYYTGAPIDRLAELEDKIESGELKECGGEDCPNFKHYQAECKRCTKKMEVKKSLEIESAVQQAVKEFAEEKVKPLIDELVELLFNDNESPCKVDNCEKGSDIPCGCSICVEENKQVWKNKLDKLIKEKFDE